jgi:hypothetical protein
MNEFLLLAVVLIYLAICYGRTTESNQNRQRPQDDRTFRAAETRHT